MVIMLIITPYNAKNVQASIKIAYNASLIHTAPNALQVSLEISAISVQRQGSISVHKIHARIVISIIACNA